MNEQPEAMIYMSYFQAPDNETIVQVKTRGNPDDIAPGGEKAIHEIDAKIPVFDLRSMRETAQMASTFAGIFGVIALILAATGIYGVVANRTELRTHAIGGRVALGASRADVCRLVRLQGLWLTILGLSLGLGLAFVLTRFIGGLLYGVSANDPVTVAGVFVLLGAMSLLACYFPARRAMRLDPVSAIREQ